MSKPISLLLLMSVLTYALLSVLVWKDLRKKEKKIALLSFFHGDLYQFNNYTFRSFGYSNKVELIILSSRDLKLNFTIPQNVKVIYKKDAERHYSMKVSECLGFGENSQIYKDLLFLLEKDPHQIAG